MAKLKLVNAVKRFDDFEVIHGIDLDIETYPFLAGATTVDEGVI